MSYILTRPSVGLSAKLLAKALGLRRLKECGRKAPLIRWGNSDGDYEDDTQLNVAELIGYSAHKLRFSTAMKEAGIPHLEIKTGIPERFPVVVRQTLTGSRGIGIVVCQDLYEFNNTPSNRYWSYWVNFSSEFGVHMLGGEIKKVMRKVWGGENDREEFPIRNSGRGYAFHRTNLENKGKLVEFMKRVYEQFPLEFGRWDIGWDSSNKRYVVIEANSAPDLTQNDDTLGIYVDFLRERINT